MRFVISTFWFVALANFSPFDAAALDCQYQEVTADRGRLIIDKQSADIETISSGSKLLSCSRASVDQSLVLAHIELGSGGTQKISRPVHVFVFRTNRRANPKKVFEYYLGDATDPQAWITYQIRRKRSGPVAIIVGRTLKEYILK